MKNYLVRNDNNLFDAAFENLFKPIFIESDINTNMKTDIKELDDKFEMAIEMPGFNKEDIQIDMQEGYVNVGAKKEVKEEDNKDGRYLRKERSISCSRSYYVGDIKEDSIKAKYENGVLSIVIPKQKELPQQPSKILIE